MSTENREIRFIIRKKVETDNLRFVWNLLKSRIPSLDSLGFVLIVYLLTVGQGAVIAQRLSKPRYAGKSSMTNYQNLSDNNRILSVVRLPSQEFFSKQFAKAELQKRFEECLLPYRTKFPSNIIREYGIQIAITQNGMRYKRDIRYSRDNMPSKDKMAISRQRALSDPYYSLAESTKYLHGYQTTKNVRIAEVFIYQAMLQARTNDEIAMADLAFKELSKLQPPENLCQWLRDYRKELITFYSLVDKGIVDEVKEGGAILSIPTDPDLYQAHMITTKLNHEATKKHFQDHPDLKPRLEIEATVNQNEQASAALALLSWSQQNFPLGLVLDIQRFLQYPKNGYLIRILQFAEKRLQQILLSPTIDSREVSQLAKLNHLLEYFKSKELGENEANVISRYTLAFSGVNKKLSAANKNWFSGSFLLYSVVVVFFAMVIKFFLKQNAHVKEKEDEELNQPKKPNKGSSRRNRQVVISVPEGSLKVLDEFDKLAIEKNKYEANVAKLDKFNSDISKLKNIPLFTGERIKIAKKALLELEPEHSRLEQQDRPKTKNEYDDLMSAKRKLENKISATQNELTKCNAILAAWRKYKLDCETAIKSKYLFKDADKLEAAIAQLVETRKILDYELDVIAESLFEEKLKVKKTLEDHITTLNVLKNKSMQMIQPLLIDISCRISEIQAGIEQTQINVDASAFQEIGDKLLCSCSDLSEMINIDCRAMSLDEIIPHVTKILAAEKILDPDHDLRKTFDDLYKKMQTCLARADALQEDFTNSNLKY